MVKRISLESGFSPRITLVSTLEKIVDEDTKLPTDIYLVVDQKSVDDRHNLNANDYRLELIIDSGNISQLKEIPCLSLSSLDMSDMFTKGFDFIKNLKNSIENGNNSGQN